MGYQTLALGLTLTIPTNGTSNWGTTLFNTTWTKISQHRHGGSGDGNQLGTSSFLPNSITGALLAKNLYMTQNPVTLLPLGTTQTVDFTTGNIQELSLASATGNVTVTLTNGLMGALYTMYVTQGASPLSLVFAGPVVWPQGQVPILSTGAGNIDKLTFYFDGTKYIGDWELNYS
jgi:hypothetical protein